MEMNIENELHTSKMTVTTELVFLNLSNFYVKRIEN